MFKTGKKFTDRLWDFSLWENLTAPVVLCVSNSLRGRIWPFVDSEGDTWKPVDTPSPAHRPSHNGCAIAPTKPNQRPFISTSVERWLDEKSHKTSLENTTREKRVTSAKSTVEDTKAVSGRSWVKDQHAPPPESTWRWAESRSYLDVKGSVSLSGDASAIFVLCSLAQDQQALTGWCSASPPLPGAEY